MKKYKQEIKDIELTITLKNDISSYQEYIDITESIVNKITDIDPKFKNKIPTFSFDGIKTIKMIIKEIK